jgi:Matrixin
VNTQSAYKLFGKASTNGLLFKLSASTPAGAAAGLGTGMAPWNGVQAGYLSLQSSGGASGPADDGTNSVGWGRFAQRNVLAATWTWTDTSGRIDEADMFFNTRYTWANLAACGGSSHDIGNVAAHEFGHALGLDHVSDDDRQATMYPSAPAGEVLKRTLTAGDRSGFLAALQP